MLLLYSAARLAGFLSSSGDVSRDVEAGDLFEGNTSEPKERSPQALSQVSKACRFFFTILVLISGLNLCAPNDQLGTTLARLAFSLSVTLATVTFMAISRVSNTSPAATSINALGGSASYLANHVNSFVMAAISSVTVLIVASHAQKPLSLPSFGLPRHRQPSVGIALSKHPFGLEREMAKSASMAMQVHEQRLAALVGAAKTESEADQSDESVNTESTGLSETRSSPEDKDVKRRESYLDTVGDAAPVSSEIISATDKQQKGQTVQEDLDSQHADAEEDSKSSSQKSQNSPAMTSDIAPSSKAGEQESPSSWGMKNNGTFTSSHGTLNKPGGGTPSTDSVDASLSSSEALDHSKLEVYGKEGGLEKDSREDSENVQSLLVSEKAKSADADPTGEARMYSSSDHTIHSDSYSKSTRDKPKDNLDLTTKKTLKDLLVETEVSGNFPQEKSDQRRDSISESATATSSVEEEQTIVIGPVPTEAEKL